MPSYPTDLTSIQKIALLSAFGDSLPTLRKYTIFEIFNAMLYVVKTGCQWKMLPSSYPNWRTVYHHFRSFGTKGIFGTVLRTLVEGCRCAIGDTPDPYTGIMDSESVRSGRPETEKGIDGHKKVKGIKRHLVTDLNGFPLAVYCSKANCHDSMGAVPLLKQLNTELPSIRELRADLGYKSLSTDDSNAITVICVKSNFGTADFKPLERRWVVERTFSWLTNYRRLTRNFEKYLTNATEMYLLGGIAFMMRYFRN